MSIFQRIKTPFETTEEEEAPPPRRTRAIGELLRARREELELDLDHIGEALRIRPAYLAALEQGRTEDLPGAAYAMGFVRAYANHLGLDGDRVLARYKADTADVIIRPDLTLPVPLGERSLPGGPIVLMALILALCGYGTWYYLSTGERTRPERVAEVPADLRQTIIPPAAPSAPPALGAAAPASTQPPRPATVSAADTDATAAPPIAAAATAAAPTAAPKPMPALVPGPGLRPLADPAADSPAPAAAANPAATGPAPSVSSARPGSAATSEPIVFPGTPSGSAPAAAPAQPAAVPGAVPATAATPASTAVSPGPASGGATGDRRVAIRALADCWIQVRTTDQTVIFSRILKAGEIYHVPARTGLSMRTGNAGALAIEVDGKPAPPIGPLGTLRRNVALDPEALVAGTAVQG